MEISARKNDSDISVPVLLNELTILGEADDASRGPDSGPGTLSCQVCLQSGRGTYSSYFRRSLFAMSS